jgi:hypothetical protein
MADRAVPGSVGLPLPGVELRLVDGDEQDVEDGDPGEVWVRGPNVFAGYWHDEAATAAAVTADGWLRTGDVGVRDRAGMLRLVDRLRDLIIVSGFNVYPGEVERVLGEDPAVAEAAVVGTPHPLTGETVVASVVARTDAAIDLATSAHPGSTSSTPCPTPPAAKSGVTSCATTRRTATPRPQRTGRWIRPDARDRPPPHASRGGGLHPCRVRAVPTRRGTGDA